ncbi:MAG: cshA 3 [Dehalococcoidia bacterium]|nr:cshA 3 [Dehalococcoidia bacterium]
MRSVKPISARFSLFNWFKKKKDDVADTQSNESRETPEKTPVIPQAPFTNGHTVPPLVTPIEPVTIHRSRRRRRRRGPAKEPQLSQNGSSDLTTSGAATNIAEDEAGETEPVVSYFGEVQVRSELARSLSDMGYMEPTPVQSQVIPLMLDGRDVVGQAQTGTGKTAAFGIPLAQSLSPDDRYVQAIVLVPTRELCMQVTKELQSLCAYSGLRVVPVFGGQAISIQLTLLQRGAHIVVGTPGRVMDHMERRTLSLNQVKVAVLDEADEMLDIGFAQDMERILRATPPERHTALFSATMPPFIRGMVRRYMKNPRWVHIHPEQVTVPEIQQVYYEVAERDKLDGLQCIIGDKNEVARTLIFCKMQVGVDRLTAKLRRSGYDVEGIHGGMTQQQRTKVMTAFKEGGLKVLIATNVASRGLDIPEVSHVVNHDAPQNLEEYVHRIGRTGRMGRTGLASTFVAEWDFDVLDQIKSAMGEALEQRTLPIYERE